MQCESEPRGADEEGMAAGRNGESKAGPALMPYLDELNPRQREAVEATRGPVLVLAGAGTGKTRVLTYRIAHLVAEGTAGEAVLAVTFTNKAAGEMKERVGDLLRRAGLGYAEPWVSTFHSFSARLLRQEAGHAGLRRDFAIYDDADQISTVKMALGKLGMEERRYPPRSLLSRISFAKNHMLTAEGLAGAAETDTDRAAARVFEVYSESMRRAGAVDFDDLLLKGLALVRDVEEVRARWQQRFQYLLVDEYQDTNRVQYEMLLALAGAERNLFVVGDEDQSIYGWRGADVGNILRFAEDFEGAKVIRLEENYRSTQTILDAAGGVVSKNVRRLGKKLVATRGAGSNLKFFQARDAGGEAEFVAGELAKWQRQDPGLRLAVLYRTNFQSRAFEEVLPRLGMRYRVVGGFSFYERAEVKDALAYVRLAMNADDDVALVRVLNTPPRGIGKTTQEALRALAVANGTSLWGAIGAMIASGTGRALVPLREFQLLMEELRGAAKEEAPGEFLRRVLDRAGYMEMVEQQDKLEDTSRAENLHELVNALEEATGQGGTLEDFLDLAALVSDADDYDERVPVTLMTLHSAKGLEFDHVYLTGLEEGLFPHQRSAGNEAQLEEERRLCYVGMTRAKETLTLTRALYRRGWGDERVVASEPSRFLGEIPGELLETAAGSFGGAGDKRYYEPETEYIPAEAGYRRKAAGTTRGAGVGRSVRKGAGPAHPLIGVRVRHPKFGAGTIIGVDGEEEERRLTVSFVDHGTKKLMERYANLTRV